MTWLLITLLIAVPLGYLVGTVLLRPAGPRAISLADGVRSEPHLIEAQRVYRSSAPRPHPVEPVRPQPEVPMANQAVLTEDFVHQAERAHLREQLAAAHGRLSAQEVELQQLRTDSSGWLSNQKDRDARFDELSDEASELRERLSVVTQRGEILSGELRQKESILQDTRDRLVMAQIELEEQKRAFNTERERHARAEAAVQQAVSRGTQQRQPTHV